jgi:hypothetical protein
MAKTVRASRRQVSGNGHGILEGFVASIIRAKGKSIELGRHQHRRWQKEAWEYWGRLGELMYPTTQLARLITQMQWRVVVDGRELARTDDDAPDAVDLFLGEITEGAGLTEVLRLLALNIQVAGECWYVNRAEDDKNDWDVYSIIDPRLDGLRDMEDWNRIHVKIVDPRNRDHAISAFSSVVGPAEELLTLEALSRAQSRSRISQAGVFLVPAEAQFPEEDDDGNPIDPLGDDLEEAMTAPIADEHHPSALVPITYQVPMETIEHFKHLVFDRPYDDKLHDRIDRVIRRIATGLDIPGEVLLGLGDVNHWGQWLLDENTKSSHALPLAARVGEVLAEAAEDFLDPDKPEGWIEISPDAADLFAKRSTVQDAFRGWDRAAVGPAYVRDAMGAEEGDAPTDEDLELLMALRGSSEAGVSTVTEEDGGTGPEVQPEPEQEGPPAEEGSPIAAAAAAPSEQDLETFGDSLALFDMALRETLRGAMDMGVRQARSRVGAKIRTALRHDPSLALINGVDNTDVAATLKARAFQLIDVDATVRATLSRDLTAFWRRETAAARSRLSERTAGSLSGRGHIQARSSAWDEAAERSVVVLVDGLTAWAVAQVPRLELDMEAVPMSLARRVVAVAGGSP